MELFLSWQYGNTTMCLVYYTNKIRLRNSAFLKSAMSLSFIQSCYIACNLFINRFVFCFENIFVFCVGFSLHSFPLFLCYVPFLQLYITLLYLDAVLPNGFILLLEI